MGRIGRVVAVGEAHHITHRGIAQQPIFHSEPARSTYLHLLGEQAARHKLRLLGYCLMTNHVHWLAVPEHPEALARTVRFVHGPYAQYVNTALGRTGHFWQNRFYSCPVENSAVGSVLAYIELNPVRARLCREAGDFRWSSAQAHLATSGEGSLVDLNWWRDFRDAERWRAVLAETDLCAETLRRATYTGRPFGSEEFVTDLEVRLQRKLERRPGGRPKKKDSAALPGQREMFA
jgi:putative transposase